MMKMFKKTAAIAASLLAVTLVGGASLTSADAAGTDTGPCITAVWKDDPTIKAQRGNCTEVEASPEATTSGQSRIVFASALNIRDRSLAGLPTHATVVNQSSGKVLIDESKTLPEDGGTEFRFYDNLMQSASAPLPSYLVTLTIGDKTYTYTFGADSFVNQGTDGDVTTYVAEAYAHYQNGGIAAGYEVA